MKDSQIVELYESRNEKAIKETDKKYGKYCYSIAYNILYDIPDSEEAVNDTYMGTWNSIPPNKPSVLSTFLGKLTRRISIDKLRKRNAEKRGGGEIPLVLSELSECISDKNTDTEKTVEMNLLIGILNGFLENLPVNERMVFLCRYWYIDSIKSISKQLGFSESKVKSMLFRTRNKLKEVLEKEGFYYKQ
ncbi:MAG: sigma-70 family RNA polymerase sigma factor [Clostridia bacterium]|nr:sigma-70 family RNA polymerase sigma factor [Clostridia bacterium]